MMDEAGYRGNAVGQVLERDNMGYAKQVLWVPMDTVAAARDRATGLPSWSINGHPVDRRDIVHLRRYPKPGFIFGRSPIEQHANTLGINLAASKYASAYYSDGAHPSAILATDQPINHADAKAIKERFVDALRGNREPVVLGAGVRYERVQDNPVEAQLLAQLQYSAADAARIIGVGIPELLGLATGASDTYKNRESVSLDLLVFTLDPWLVKIENMISQLLPAPHVVRFNRNALLRTDLVQRYNAYRTSLGPTEPFATVNEVRALEDLPPVPWGDEKPVTGAQSDLSASGAAADTKELPK
jgi:HK97 family phage portal protein